MEHRRYVCTNLLLRLSIGVDAVDLDDWGTLGQIGSDNDLTTGQTQRKRGRDMKTYGNSHQFFDVLDPVSGVRNAKTFEFRLDLGHRQKPLFRAFRLCGNSLSAAQDNFIVISVILVE